MYGEEGNPVAPIVGAAKMLHSWLSEHPDPEVRAAYDRGREKALADENLAQGQHPWAYLAGQLGQALTLPMGVAGGATGLARVGRGIAAGATGAGLYDTGQAISEGGSPGDVAAAGAKGALTGAAFGGVGGG